jgi:hypothetical protein
MRGWAIVGCGMLVCPAAIARAAPLDSAIQSLNDVAFVSGHAPAAGGVVLGRAADPAHPALSVSFTRPVLPDMTVATVPPPEQSAGSGLRLGSEVKVSTVGAFVQRQLEAMGVKDGAAAYGDQSRFYLFAAVHGQAVGMNLVSGSGGLHRDGWSSDTSSALVGDGQVGLGWRKGAVEADLGYVHRGVHIRNAPRGASDSYADDMAALSFTLRPNW